MQALVLGTAQWGNPYGLTNSQGRLEDHQIEAIAAVALESGIRFADTASGYGDAEVRLAPWAKQFEVTTKVMGAVSISVEDQLAKSLGALELDQVRCCLIHDWPSLTQDQAEAAVKGLERAKARGLVAKIGISGYDEADLNRAIEIFKKVEAVQVPVSILDQRLVGSSAIEQLTVTGTEIQARSIFLQGLLASRSDSALGNHPDINRFHDSCEELKIRPIQVALSFVQGLAWVDQLVVGITSASELAEIVNASQLNESADWHGVSSSVEPSTDLNLIDPRHWTS